MVSYHVDIPRASIIPEQHVAYVDSNSYWFYHSLPFVKDNVSWHILFVQLDHVWYCTACDVVEVMAGALVDVVPGALAKAHELQPIRRTPFWGAFHN